MNSKLKVVLWKNLIIRKRHWFLTACETLLPVLIFLLLSYGRSKLPFLGRADVDVTNNYKEVINYIPMGLNLGETKIYYAPNTDFYNNIIHSVQEKFSIINNDVKSFPNELSLMRFFESTGNNQTLIVIVFHSTENLKKLDYTLKYHQSGLKWETESLYNNPYDFQPGTGTPYNFKGYLQLQLAIDMSYIEQISGNQTDNIYIDIQEFPYPPYKADNGLTPMFYHFLPLVTLISFIFVCPTIIQRVVAEKYSGIKELVKMVGMRSWMLWLGWFIYSILPMFGSVIVIVFLLKLSLFGSPLPVIEYTASSIVFVFLMLYVLVSCIVALFLSTLINKPTLATLVGLVFWLLSYIIPVYTLNSDGNSSAYSLLMMLFLPNTALYFGYSTIALYEEREIGVNWSNFNTPVDGSSDTITMANICLILVSNCLLFTMLTFYTDAINPGKYGIKKSVTFPISYLFNLFKNKQTLETSENLHLEIMEKGNFNVGIQLQNVYKKFKSKHYAVKDLSMDIYQDQITVLLGHNGAGKSTTIGMITGMLRRTAGKIYINGEETNSRSALSNSIGLCTQHNLFFPDLTVREHLKFFAMLKGKVDDVEIDDLLEKLCLSEKANDMPHTLSGGMKRKLCLGMAVIGNSKILILDEPSSGMDPESRREMWDLLLKLRNNKTILITTHFMEEADALGDWIAIMEEGNLRCFGTPMTLKKKYKTGCYLKLLINEMTNVNNAVEKLKQQIRVNLPESIHSNIEYRKADGYELSIFLPADRKYTELFEFLEANKECLNISCMSLASTTLEDVFLRLKQGDNTIEKENFNIEKFKGDVETSFIKTVQALMCKRFNFMCNKWKDYLFPIIIANGLMLLCIALSSVSVKDILTRSHPLKMDLSAYGETSVYFNYTQHSDAERLAGFYDKLVKNRHSFPFSTADVSNAIVRQGIQNLQYYRRHMVASAEFVQNGNELQLTGLYNALAKHSAPISLNLITNALTQFLLGEEYSISLTNHPLKDIDNDHPKIFSDMRIHVLWIMILPIGFLLFLGTFIYFPYFETSSNFIQLQYMCGITPLCYWLCLLFFDYIVYILFAIAIGLISMLWIPFRGIHELGLMFEIIVLFGISGIPYAYLFSRKKCLASSYAGFIVSGIIFGIIPCLIVIALINSGDNEYMHIGNALTIIFRILLPPFIFTYTGVEFSKLVIQKYHYENMDYGAKLAYCSTYMEHPCCVKDDASCSTIYENVVDGKTWLCIFVGALIFLSLSVISLNNIKTVFNKIRRLIRKKSSECTQHEECRSNFQSQKMLNVKCLKKSFCKKVVSHVSFQLDKGECVGLLGVNGAGKSTTFRMLTREEIQDSGSFTIKRKDKELKEDECLKFMGYCPQNDSLNIYLTGRQILNTMAMLRGLKEKDTIVDNMLELFELTPFADIPCQFYSGGNKRKLSFAISILGLPDVVLLDEPTNGVDVYTRRKFWNLIHMLKDEKEIAFLLTSHSMSECEAVCNKVNIMRCGKIEKNGTLCQLKSGQGVTVKFKLNSNISSRPVEEVDSSSGDISLSYMEALKSRLKKTYDGDVKDEHLGYLHYYIKPNTKRWSVLFRELDNLQKSMAEFIEDYSVTDATLEDVFLNVQTK